eukprot:m.488425 g.488425  ORF g.488425 m.488425 type:complete len:59 (-) comp88027_c0_seq1:4-180(-)
MLATILRRWLDCTTLLPKPGAKRNRTAAVATLTFSRYNPTQMSLQPHREESPPAATST